MWFDREASVAGEDSSKILAKAIHSPEDLSLDELLVVHAHHEMALAEILHAGYFSESEIEIFSHDWRADGISVAQENFAYPFGRAWWAKRREHIGFPPVVEVIDQALAENPNYRADFFDSLGHVFNPK